MKTERKPETIPEHNGWANYPTWAVKLWIDNDQAPYEYWHNLASHCQASAAKDANVQQNIWTPEQAAKYRLAYHLRDEIESGGAALDEASMYADLLGWALAYVKWDDIAESLLQDINES